MFKNIGFSVALLGATLAFNTSLSMADQNAPATVKIAEVGGGKILTGSDDMSLYIFDKDTAGHSNCNGGCAEKWPPLMASDSAKAVGGFSIVTRADGGLQWAYNDMPLYGWFKDNKAGDVTGDGVKGVWHLARP